VADIGNLDQAMDRHAAALVLFARQFTRSHADAEDIVQEAFVRFWKSGRHAKDPLAYIYACVRNYALDQRRGQTRRSRREQDAAANESCPPLFLEDCERKELSVAVQEALAGLPREQAEVLVMKIWGQLTFAQIAETLAIPPNTAASRYRYAAESLRQALAQEMQP
jgi:RNA polymerase sigma-70 factor (ECF subfamily)